MTWRDAVRITMCLKLVCMLTTDPQVAHADPNRRQAHVSKRPTFRLASDVEKRYLKAYIEGFRYNRYSDPHVWGCMHCSDHLALSNPGSEWAWGRRTQFMSIDEIKKHLVEK